MAKSRRQSFAARLGNWARRNARRPWLPPLLTAFPAADFVLPFMPNQLLLAGLSMLAPNRWPAFALAFAAGTACAGGAIAFGLQALAIGINSFVNAEEATGALLIAVEQFRNNGLWFLAAIALLPWTPRISVIACAIVGFSPFAIFSTLFLARLIPNAGLGILGAYGPTIAARFNFIRLLIGRVQAASRPD